MSETVENTRNAEKKCKGITPLRIGGVLVIAVALVILQYAELHGRHIEEKRKGSINTLSMWTILAESMNFEENKGKLPPWDVDKPGEFMYDRENINSLYKVGANYTLGIKDKETSVLMVADFLDNKVGYYLDEFPEDGRYYYMSYAITNEAEGMAMLDLYRKGLESGEELNTDKKVAQGTGTSGGDTLFFMHSNLGWLLENEAKVAPKGSNIHLKIPVVFERPNRYDKPGGWVVFLHSKPRWIDYPGEFPMTEFFIGALEAFEAEFKKEESE